MSQETIRDAVEDSITWPVRKVIPIIPGDYRYTPDEIHEVELLMFFSGRYAQHFFSRF